MRRILVLLSLLLCSCTAPVCNHVDMSWIRTQAPIPDGTELIKKNNHGNICEAVVSIDGNIVPLYAGEDFLLVGKMFKDRKFITGETLASLKDVAESEAERAKEIKRLKAERRRSFFKQNWNRLEDLTAFSFTPEGPRSSVYLVTDPRCSHCKHLIDDMKRLAVENHFQIKMVLFPVMGSESYNMAGQAICGRVPFEKYGQIKFKKEFQPCPGARALMDRTISFFSEADMAFVPVVIAGDGSWVVEGARIQKIKAHLGIGNDDCDDDDSEAGCGEVQ